MQKLFDISTVFIIFNYTAKISHSNKSYCYLMFQVLSHPIRNNMHWNLCNTLPLGWAWECFNRRLWSYTFSGILFHNNSNIFGSTIKDWKYDNF